MKNSLLSFQLAFKTIIKDKINILLTLIPICGGITLYYYLGGLIYSSALPYGQKLIEDYFQYKAMSTLIYYISSITLSILFFFLINWTFVLITSFIASPFNDILSARIEAAHHHKPLPNAQATLSTLFKNLLLTMITEAKKILFILTLSVLAFALGLFPLFAPLSLFITALILAMGYLDYSWCRHNFSLGQCTKSLKAHPLSYALGGGIFLFFVSIPVINLLVPSLATSYFTILWLKNNSS